MKHLSFLLLASAMLLAACSPQENQTNNPTPSSSNSEVSTQEVVPSTSNTTEMSDAEMSQPCTTPYSNQKNNTEEGTFTTISFDSPCQWLIKSINDLEISSSSPNEEASFFYPSGDFGLHDALIEKTTIEANDGTTYNVTWFEFENEKGGIVQTNIGTYKYNIGLQYKTNEQKVELENMIKSLVVTTDEINPI